MRIKPVDSETRYYLCKHVEDPEVEIERILDEHETMRQAIETAEARLGLALDEFRGGLSRILDALGALDGSKP